MALDGEKLPMVFFPRFTTFNVDPGNGVKSFRTTPVDMLEYSAYSMTFWRGEYVNVSDLTFDIEQSADLTLWELIGQATITTAGGDYVTANRPTARYVRCSAKVTPDGSGSSGAVTLWSTGYVHKTQA